MKLEATKDRDVDLCLARQFGQLYYRELDSPTVRMAFEKMFHGDKEALAQFESGVIFEDQRRMTMRLSRDQYRTHYETRRQDGSNSI